MWIDTAGTLPANSQLTVLLSIRLSCLVPIDSCSQSRLTNNWSRSASPFKTPPRSQVYTFPTPESNPQPSSQQGSPQLALQKAHTAVQEDTQDSSSCMVEHRHSRKRM
ncbi:hypothetical protein BASA62_009793 [Batrachochytrium salamandrivorans]|nr:hypothetical protein BASA62_009793 [Batrachochytrium salamandrivorans]